MASRRNTLSRLSCIGNDCTPLQSGKKIQGRGFIPTRKLLHHGLRTHKGYGQALLKDLKVGCMHRQGFNSRVVLCRRCQLYNSLGELHCTYITTQCGSADTGDWNHLLSSTGTIIRIPYIPTSSSSSPGKAGYSCASLVRWMLHRLAERGLTRLTSWFINTRWSMVLSGCFFRLNAISQLILFYYY